MRSRWTSLVRPSLIRAVAAGVGFALATLPLSAAITLAAGKADAPGWEIALMVSLVAGLFGGAGGLGAAPAAWLEARARRASVERALLLALLCGLLVPLAGAFIAAQLGYVVGVARGGVDAGLDALGRLVDGARRDLGQVVAFAGGASAAVALSVTLLTVLRARAVSTGRQVLAGALLSLSAGGLLCLSSGAAIAVASRGERTDFDALLAASPIAGGVLMGALLCSFTLVAYGLPLALTLPPALALGDRLGGRIEDAAPAGPSDLPVEAA